MRAFMFHVGALLVLIVATTELRAQALTMFRGVPAKKVTTDGDRSVAEAIPPTSTGNLQVVISRIGDRYYWASRENTELVRVDAGAFVNYLAVNGAGYVKIVKPEMKEAAALLSDTESKYDYVEHIVFGLRSITYYGAKREIVP